jgi:hypothetical protein
MIWLVAALATIVLAIVAALAVPVQLEVSAELTDRLRGRVRLRWWFAVINVTSGATVANKHPAAVATPRSAATPTGGGRAMLAALRTSGLVPSAMRLVRVLLARIHLRRFHLRARYGLGDPADTGQLSGILAPVLALASARGMDVRCRPEFTDAVLDGSCSGTIAVRPLSVFAVIIAFLCSPSVWRAARAWRRVS